MKRIALTAGLVLAVLVPGAALAKAPTARHVTQYEHAYGHVRHVFGRRAPGRNIVRWGFDAHHRATDAQVLRSIGVLHRMFAPAPVFVPSPSVAGTPVAAQAQALAQSPAAYAPAGGAGGVPACASESGTNYSTGPANTNPSGATGRYQVIPSTHAAVCGDLGWSPAEQDQCAARIYAAQGAGAWVGCGG